MRTLPRRAAALAALALLGGCDRSFAPEANAADSQPQPQDTASGRQAAPAPPAQPRISPPPAEAISDSAITAQVKSALHADPALAGADLSVDTAHGVVSLTGTVKSPEQVAEAAARAQEPDGVVRLDTHVAVTPP